MAIKEITYKGKTQTVKQWSDELAIPVKTIYQRLTLDWPSELVLSRHKFNYCNNFNAASIVKNNIEDLEQYPSNINNKQAKCCDINYKCGFAMPLNDWNDIQHDPSNCNYYCLWLGKFVKGNDPICL